MLELRDRNVDVLVIDDLSEGHETALRGVELCEGSTLDREFLAQVFASHPIDAVCHFAARAASIRSATGATLNTM